MFYVESLRSLNYCEEGEMHILDGSYESGGKYS